MWLPRKVPTTLPSSRPSSPCPVIRSGRTGLAGEFGDTIEFSLQLDSNPHFTGSVLASVARAAYRMRQNGQVGAYTMFDIPPALLSPLSAEELRAHLM